MWRLIFLFILIIIILLAIYPFLIKFEVKCNILRLKGGVSVKIFNKIKNEYKFRVKNGYVYIYFNNKERKEKISNKNINIVFILNLIKQIYFRHQLLNSNLIANFGYVNDSLITASGCGLIDVISKCAMCKLKNNKKLAHIFVEVSPKYNEDIFNIKLIYEMRMSVFDALYSLLITAGKTLYFKFVLKKFKKE